MLFPFIWTWLRHSPADKFRLPQVFKSLLTGGTQIQVQSYKFKYRRPKVDLSILVHGQSNKLHLICQRGTKVTVCDSPGLEPRDEQGKAEWDCWALWPVLQCTFIICSWVHKTLKAEVLSCHHPGWGPLQHPNQLTARLPIISQGLHVPCHSHKRDLQQGEDQAQHGHIIFF